jgi:glycosyltransferase involved in cell wall biosynthesis
MSWNGDGAAQFRGGDSAPDGEMQEAGLHLNRPRLLYMITRAERGGAQAHVLEVAEGMRNDFEVHVATGEEGYLTQACRDASIPVHIIPHLRREVNPFFDVPAWFETLHLVRKIRPDLIHAHTWKSGFIGRSVAAVHGTPSIYTVHMWPFGPALPLTWQIIGPRIERLAARWSRRLITVSESAAEIGRQYRIAPASRIIAIENGIKDCAVRAELHSRTVPVIAMVARFTSLKDHDTLLRAFAKLDSPAKLMLVGDGATRGAAEKLARELGIQQKVEFTGERSDIETLLREVDIFVLASKNELLPISIIEAMRAGLPVIASRLGGIPRLTVDGATGLLVESCSVTELQQALSRLVNDRELRIQFGRSGRLRYEQKFTSREMCAQTLSVYQDVLAENERARALEAEFASQK